MGSYAECWLGPFYLGTTKDDIDPGLMRLFRSADKNVVRGRKQDLPFQMRGWMNYVEDDEELSVVFYRAPIPLVRDRLELQGYTLDLARSVFTTSIRADAARYSAYREDPLRQYFEPISRLLEMTDVDQWLTSLKLIKDKGLKQRRKGGTTTRHKGALIDYMLTTDWYGYSGPDLNVALRLAMEICSDCDELIYDITDLIQSEYFSIDDDLVSYAQGLSSGDYSSGAKVIVLTEGRTDSWIISDSLRVLYPHLAEYFTFMDFEGARVGGGAGSLANIVKAFAGAGIINKMVAVFDNDTAAEAAIRSLRSIRLPANIKILKLPELDVLRKYPTIGPSGLIVMDVNGIAGSIELYLGADALSDEGGNLTPVQWTGFESSLGKYQGEVLFKDKIRERFKHMVEAYTKDPTLPKGADWSGIRTILSAIFVAFHQFDGEQITSFVKEYYAQ